MSNRNPLVVGPPKPFKDSSPEGMVFTNNDGHALRKTYFYAGVELNDNVTGEPHPVPLYRFIAWQDRLVYRTRLTLSETQRLQLVEQRRRLDFYQMGDVARMLFRHWESDEHRSVEIHQLKEGARA